MISHSGTETGQQKELGLGVGGDREVGEGRLDKIWKVGEAI